MISEISEVTLATDRDQAKSGCGTPCHGRFSCSWSTTCSDWMSKSVSRRISGAIIAVCAMKKLNVSRVSTEELRRSKYFNPSSSDFEFKPVAVVKMLADSSQIHTLVVGISFRCRM